ncbi:hypothetical protein [Winogradskyella sp. SYSU M77433]|uniref:hypothetical protein n=1 Tax=Winogradskyella sp. SYSU M77433 TaxID=3042722 RepID=UPI002481640C|nr:hypothetical protein [Winogradskyella sp. SYSU M77433]MDH7911352.1 hypothetical protein [Winogradskyella sp. SYSU M77433]
MSQTYKFKSLEIAKNGKEKKETTKDPNKLNVYEVGETKTIDFELLDGTRQNFSYAHYITSWIGKDGDERVIKIFFATHLVTIKGYCLDPVYEAVASLKLKKLKANNVRYIKSIEEGKTYIIMIEIRWKNNQLDKS